MSTASQRPTIVKVIPGLLILFGVMDLGSGLLLEFGPVSRGDVSSVMLGVAVIAGLTQIISGLHFLNRDLSGCIIYVATMPILILIVFINGAYILGFASIVVYAAFTYFMYRPDFTNWMVARPQE